MFQTITGKPFCPIAAIAAPENFCCAGKLFGGLVSQTRTPPECVGNSKGRPGGGSGNPQGVGGRKDYVTRAPLRKLTGRGKGSSQNLRHEQRRHSVQFLRRQLVRQLGP